MSDLDLDQAALAKYGDDEERNAANGGFFSKIMEHITKPRGVASPSSSPAPGNRGRNRLGSSRALEEFNRTFDDNTAEDDAADSKRKRRRAAAEDDDNPLIQSAGSAEGPQLTAPSESNLAAQPRRPRKRARLDGDGSESVHSSSASSASESTGSRSGSRSRPSRTRVSRPRRRMPNVPSLPAAGVSGADVPLSYYLNSDDDDKEKARDAADRKQLPSDGGAKHGVAAAAGGRGDVKDHQPANQVKRFRPLLDYPSFRDPEEEKIAAETNVIGDPCPFCVFTAKDAKTEDSWSKKMERLWRLYGKTETEFLVDYVQRQFEANFRDHIPENRKGKRPYMTKRMVYDHIVCHCRSDEIRRNHHLNVIVRFQQILEENGVVREDEFGQVTLDPIGAKNYGALMTHEWKLRGER
jgi:hypothetical protein